MHRPFSRPRPLVALAALALAASVACDRAPERAADSVLAEDLALARSVTPEPVFQDTALGTAAPARADRPAPAPARAPRATPARTPPRPAPARETPAPAADVVAETPAPAPTPAPAVARGIAPGTGMRFETGGRICTNAGRPGDKIVATLTEAVRGEDGTVVPAGTKAVLEVASMTRGERPEETTIAFRVRALVVGGASLPVAADVAVLDTLERQRVDGRGSDAKKVAAGAVLGALAGQVLGKDTKSTVIGAAAGAAAGTAVAVKTAVYEGCLPAGSDVRVTLTSPLVVAER